MGLGEPNPEIPDPEPQESQKQHKTPLSSLAGQKKTKESEPIIAWSGNWSDLGLGFGPGLNPQLPASQVMRLLLQLLQCCTEIEPLFQQKYKKK